MLKIWNVNLPESEYTKLAYSIECELTCYISASFASQSVAILLLFLLFIPSLQITTGQALPNFLQVTTVTGVQLLRSPLPAHDILGFA